MSASQDVPVTETQGDGDKLSSRFRSRANGSLSKNDFGLAIHRPADTSENSQRMADAVMDVRSVRYTSRVWMCDQSFTSLVTPALKLPAWQPMTAAFIAPTEAPTTTGYGFLLTGDRSEIAFKTPI